jgi:hypothetical protein
LPTFARANEIRRLEDVRATAPLRAHLHDPLMTRSGFEHRAAFVDGLCKGLLNIHILAGLAGENGWQGMPMIGCGNQHHIDIFPVEDSAEILDGIGFSAALFFANLDTFGQVRVVHIADDCAVNFRIEKETFEIPLPHTAATDQTQTDFAAGTRFGGADRPDEGGGQAAQSQWREANGEGGSAQEFATGHLAHN